MLIHPPTHPSTPTQLYTTHQLNIDTLTHQAKESQISSAHGKCDPKSGDLYKEELISVGGKGRLILVNQVVLAGPYVLTLARILKPVTLFTANITQRHMNYNVFFLLNNVEILLMSLDAYRHPQNPLFRQYEPCEISGIASYRCLKMLSIAPL